MLGCINPPHVRVGLDTGVGSTLMYLTVNTPNDRGVNTPNGNT